MATDGGDSLWQESWPPVNPWHLVLAGLAASILALFLSLVQNQWLPGEGSASVLVPLRGIAITIGVILAAGAVSVRLRTTSWEFEERVVSASLTGLGAFAVLLGWLAMDQAWDSLAMFLGVVAFVGFAGCTIILLPRNARRITAVALVFLHFCGILSAVTSAPPPGAAPPWITQVVWTRLSRPYLQFMYLNNAYHFYSPEPGPACQLWFYIKFDDDTNTGEWLKVPKREDYATRQEYQRILSVTENANQLFPQAPPMLALMYQQRIMAGNTYYPQIKVAPWNADTSEGTPPAFQYREPNLISKRIIQSYAKHVGQTYHSDAHPGAPVKSVKMYRVVHMIIAPEQMADHFLEPDDPTNFTPYYQGEFDRDGNMLQPTDPFLYWLTPILYEPKPGHKPAPSRASKPVQWNSEDYEIVDYCKLHAEGRSK